MRGPSRWTGCALGVLTLLRLEQGAPAQTPELPEVLTLAGDYVTDFEARLGGIVLEEDYEQQVLPGPAQRGNARTRRRRMKADLLMVRPAAEGRWMQFRDVYEVDGRPVRDRDERLARLFLQPPTASSLSQAESIMLESSRYNIGGIGRTINLPMLALSYFAPNHRARSVFSRTDAGKVDQLAVLARPDAIWAVEFREVAPETLIRTTGERDLPAHGRAWIDAATGRILKTELVAKDPAVEGRIEVSYRFETSIGFLVPAEMREQYTDGGLRTRIVGHARYGNLKRFTVTTEETLRKPPG